MKVKQSIFLSSSKESQRSRWMRSAILLMLSRIVYLGFKYLGTTINSSDIIRIRSSRESHLRTGVTTLSVSRYEAELSLDRQTCNLQDAHPPVLLYGAEAWVLLHTDAAALRAREKNTMQDFRFWSHRVRLPHLNEPRIAWALRDESRCWVTKVKTVAPI